MHGYRANTNTWHQSNWSQGQNPSPPLTNPQQQPYQTSTWPSSGHWTGQSSNPYPQQHQQPQQQQVYSQKELEQQWARYYELQQQWREYYQRMGIPFPEGTAPHMYGYPSTAAQPAQLTTQSTTQTATQSSRPQEEVKRVQPTQQEQKPVQENNWPDSLRRYVERSLAEASDASAKSAIEVELQSIIQNAVARGELWQRNWNVESTPMSRLKLNNNNASNPPRKRRWEDMTPRTAAVSLTSIQDEQEKNRTTYWSASPSPSGSTQSSGRRPDNQKKRAGWNAHVDDDSLSTEEAEQRNRRLARFQTHKQSSPVNRYNPHAAFHQAKMVQSALEQAERQGVELDLSTFAVKGTCTELEKRYLRLTSVPDPSTVRPQDILEKSLAMITQRWSASAHNHNGQTRKVEKPSPTDVTYLWVCEQLKSIRQDLTVQHIKNEFTVKVYETHARIALRESDLKEFNQCMTQLQDMYSSTELGSEESKAEFAGYNILYLLYTQHKYGQPKSEVANLLATLSKSLMKSNNVQHAIAVYQCLERRMHHSFFRLYENAPALGHKLMDLLVGFVRYRALQAASRAFRPSVPVEAIRNEFLHLACTSQAQSNGDWKQLVTENTKVVLTGDDRQCMDMKASMIAFVGNYQWPVLDGDSVQHSA